MGFLAGEATQGELQGELLLSLDVTERCSQYMALVMTKKMISCRICFAHSFSCVPATPEVSHRFMKN